MIEMVYSSKETEELSEVRVPKNIHQIGDNTSSRKIYIEDYVMTSLKKIPEDENSIKYGVLLGEIKRAKGNTYVFVKGLVETREIIENSVIFNDDIWSSIYKDIKKYFEGLEIVGWFVSVPYTVRNDMSSIQKIHLDNFAGNDKVCYLSDRTENEEGFFAYETGSLAKQLGYYIFYEKNEKMKRYLKQTQGSRSVAVGTDNSVSQMIVDVPFKNVSKISEKNEEKIVQNANSKAQKTSAVMQKADDATQKANIKSQRATGATKKVDTVHEIEKNVENIHSNNAKQHMSFRDVIKEQVKEDKGKGFKQGGLAYGISSMLIIALLMSTVVMLNNYGELKSLKASIENMSGDGSVEAMNEMLSAVMPTTIESNENASQGENVVNSGETEKSSSILSENGQADESENGQADESENGQATDTANAIDETNITDTGDGEDTANSANSANPADVSANDIQIEPVIEENAPASVHSGSYHTVTAGQTLYDISMSYYGNSLMVDRIKEVNSIDDDYMIQEGQEILLP